MVYFSWMIQNKCYEVYVYAKGSHSIKQTHVRRTMRRETIRERDHHLFPRDSTNECDSQKQTRTTQHIQTSVVSFFFQEKKTILFFSFLLLLFYFLAFFFSNKQLIYFKDNVKLKTDKLYKTVLLNDFCICWIYWNHILRKTSWWGIYLKLIYFLTF